MIEPAASTWHDTATVLSIDSRALIEGQRTHAALGTTFRSLSPVVGCFPGEVAGMGPEDNDLAVASGRRPFERGIRTGRVRVNCHDCDDVTTPFGDDKQSVVGRDKPLYAFDRYVELKTARMNPGQR